MCWGGCILLVLVVSPALTVCIICRKLNKHKHLHGSDFRVQMYMHVHVYRHALLCEYCGIVL